LYNENLAVGVDRVDMLLVSVVVVVEVVEAVGRGSSQVGRLASLSISSGFKVRITNGSNAYCR
jgi:ABC-type proline/glycine betaine transport system permease subunit